MSYLEIDNLSLSLPRFNLRNIQISLPKGKALVILGPSGSGKSVLLETIAGFYKPDAGKIRLDGRDITVFPPETRQTGFMFQDHALFPHRTVLENVMFSRRFKQQEKCVLDPVQVMAMLHIDHLADRFPAKLSGGERQRVALARAMIQQPKLFLFDEPMSALDAKAREDLQEELRLMQRSLSMTAIYVTHSQLEAQTLGDFICLINNGQVIQTGSQAEVFNRPATAWAAQFVGMNNLLDGQVVESVCQAYKYNLVSVSVQGLGTLRVQGDYNVRSGDQVLVGIRPEDISLDLEDSQLNSGANLNNSLTATVSGLMPWGVVYKLHLQCPILLTAYVSKQLVENANLSEGSSVRVSFPPEAMHLILKNLGDGHENTCLRR